MTGHTFIWAFATWRPIVPGRGGLVAECMTCGTSRQSTWNELAQEGWFASDDEPAQRLCAACARVVREEFAA